MMLNLFLQTARLVGSTRASAGTADVSGIGFFLPVIVFLLVFVVLFALLMKTKIVGGNPWLSLFVSLFISAIFVSFGGVRDLVTSVVPWIAVFLVGLFFIMLLGAFIMGKASEVPKGFLMWLFIILIVVAFILAGVDALGSGGLAGYLPGPFFGLGVSEGPMLFFFEWLYSPRVFGSVLLIVIAILFSFILVKAGG